MTAEEWHVDHTTPEHEDWQAERLQAWLDAHGGATDGAGRIVEGPVTDADDERVAVIRGDRP